MKNWTWKTWVMAVVVGLIFIGAGAGVIYGVVSEDDPTPLGVCWASDGRVQYVRSDLEEDLADPICAEPEDLVWDHHPLTIALVAGDEEYSDALASSIEIWNRVGPLFQQTEEPENADIVVDWYAAFESGDGVDPVIGESDGYCLHRREGGRMRAEMGVRPSGDIRVEMQTGAHELGHCLGMGHWIWGVMRTDYAGNDRNADRMTPDRVGDGQADLIRELYGL
jgi:hypothetical protein